MLVNVRKIKEQQKTSTAVNNDDLNQLLKIATNKVNEEVPSSQRQLYEMAEIAATGTPLIPLVGEVAKYVSMPAISVGQFGGDAITEVAGYGSKLTEQLKMSDMPDFQEKVVNILTVAKGVRLPKKDEKIGMIDKLLNKTKYTREKLISDFSTVKDQINSMIAVVDKRQEVLSTANINLDVLYTNNVAEYENLTRYIEIGEAVIGYKKQELEVMKSFVGGDLLKAQNANDLAALIVRWEERIDGLRKFQMSAIQTAPQIRAMQNNNLKLIDKFVDLKNITIPSWEKQFALQINLQDQQKANAVANAIDDATNEFMLANSQLLCDTSTSIAKSNQRGSIYIETLEGVQQNLVNMFDSIKTINEEGDAARKDAFNRMEDMKKVYLQISKDGLS